MSVRESPRRELAPGEWEGRPRPGRARRGIAIVASGLLVAAGLTGGGWWLGHRDSQQPAAAAPTVPATGAPTGAPTASGGQPTMTASPSTTGTAPAAVGSWRTLPAAPVPGGMYASVWTGRELLIHSPYTGRSVGAAYNPTTRTWRRLPPAPGVIQNVEGGHHAVWTGTEMLTWGMLNAAYNPATDRWRPIGRVGPAGPSVVVWTGLQVLTWGGGCCGGYSADGAAYPPATDSSQPLPASPLAGRHTTGVWTGREMIVVGGEGDATGTPGGYTVFADAAAYNPATQRWRRLPPMPAPRAGATATWTGAEVLVVGGRHEVGGRSVEYADGVAYNPATNRWRRLPGMSTSRFLHAAVWTGSRLLVTGGVTMRGNERTAPPRGQAYDPTTDRWSALPISPLRARYSQVAVWTGSQLLVWGGYPARDSDYRLPAFADGAAYTPPAT